MPQQHPFSEIVNLPRDDDADEVLEPTAHGALHWAPLHDRGYSARMQELARWVADAQPEVCVVDVSVEVAVFLRLLGVPVVAFVLPGDRTDPPHQLVHQIADHLVAAWPGDLNFPSWLRPHAAKTSFVGGISRFEGRMPTQRHSVNADDDPTVLVLGGAGGASADAAPPTGLPGIRWSALGGSARWVADPWPDICSADVVVTHAGQNSIADIAAAQRPTVVVPQARPFDEQLTTARVLDRHGLAVCSRHWPTQTQWPALIDRARAGDPTQWRRWQTSGAAARAAAAIEATARRSRPRVP